MLYLLVSIFQHEGVEDEPFEEILLEHGGNETRGGRMGHETPQGLSGMLQIDSLTDDEDDDDFRAEIVKEEHVAPDAKDDIETFTLDPEFDYDNTANLATRT